MLKIVITLVEPPARFDEIVTVPEAVVVPKRRVKTMSAAPPVRFMELIWTELGRKYGSLEESAGL